MRDKMTSTPSRHAGIRNPQVAGRNRSAGLTLIELIVGVAILSIMILAFGIIMSESRKVVSVSQANMRGNSEAYAIAQTIREDIRHLTQNGFLCITERDVAGLPAKAQTLVYTAANPSPSVTNSAIAGANGTVAAMGLCNNTKPATAGGGPVLFRASWLLSSTIGVTAADKDVFFSTAGATSDLSMFQTAARGGLDSYITNILTTAGYVPSQVVCPPTTLAEVNELWKYLATNCTDLQISWMDGSVYPAAEVAKAGQIRWFDRNAPKDSTWAAKTIASGTVEYADAAGNYRALWTHHDQTNWPVAIRIRFKLNDPNLAEQFRVSGVDYEVICPIAR